MTLEGGSTEFRSYLQTKAGPCLTVIRQTKSHPTERSVMSANRTSSPGGHAAKTALSKSGKSKVLPSAEILKALPLGVVLLHLEDPQDVNTLKIVDLNPAAADI